MRENVATAECEAVEYKGEYALLYEGRLDKTTVPEGFHVYDIREDMGEPSTIENSVKVDFYGSIILNRPLEIPECGFINIGEEDINYLGYSATTADPSLLHHCCEFGYDVRPPFAL